MPRQNHADNMSLVSIVNLQLYTETEQAILVGPPGLDDASKEKTWLPISQVAHLGFSGIGTVGDIEIPRWLAEEKELDFEE